MPERYDFVSIGGGAAGFYAALRLSERFPEMRIAILEATPRFLSKVKVSGGGRCNITHDAHEATKLSSNYPRGSKELISAFSRFGPNPMREWLRSHGIETKVESDGRVFPVTDSSQTIIDTFLELARRYRLHLLKEWPVTRLEKAEGLFRIHSQPRIEVIEASRVLLATGGSPKGHDLARSLGHQITPLSPSLFSFNIPKDIRLKDLSGLSFERVLGQLKIGPKDFRAEGPLLITHWGLSGPSILKLSAFASREFKESQYQATLVLNFLPEISESDFNHFFESKRTGQGRKMLRNDRPYELPLRFWQRLLEVLGIPEQRIWAEVLRSERQRLFEELTKGQYAVDGKTTNKEEFVTAGGVSRTEIDFRTMESRVCSDLFLAGEMIDVDGITGGFNFQACWSEAEALASNLKLR